MKLPFPRRVYERNAEIYRLLANPKRLEILNLLRVQEQTFSDLVSLLGLPKANVAQHLAILRHMRVVRTRKKGKNTYYAITDPLIVAPCKIFSDLWKKQIFINPAVSRGRA